MKRSNRWRGYGWSKRCDWKRKRRKTENKNGEQRRIKWTKNAKQEKMSKSTRSNEYSLPRIRKTFNKLCRMGLVRLHFLMILRRNEVSVVEKENISKFLYIGHKIKCFVYVYLFDLELTFEFWMINDFIPSNDSSIHHIQICTTLFETGHTFSFHSFSYFCLAECNTCWLCFPTTFRQIQDTPFNLSAFTYCKLLFKRCIDSSLIIIFHFFLAFFFSFALVRTFLIFHCFFVYHLPFTTSSAANIISNFFCSLACNILSLTIDY